MAKRTPMRGVVRAKTYSIFTRAVEEGVIHGLVRAYKHSDTPAEETVKDEVAQAVVNEVCEYFSFDAPDEVKE